MRNNAIDDINMLIVQAQSMLAHHAAQNNFNPIYNALRDLLADAENETRNLLKNGK